MQIVNDDVCEVYSTLYRAYIRCKICTYIVLTHTARCGYVVRTLGVNFVRCESSDAVLYSRRYVPIRDASMYGAYSYFYR